MPLRAGIRRECAAFARRRENDGCLTGTRAASASFWWRSISARPTLPKVWPNCVCWRPAPGSRFSARCRASAAAPTQPCFAGSGKAEEIAALVAATEADVVIFNHELSPAQERNLERRLHCRVIDRTTLILDIFARRAQSAEGKLQVELAQLQHLSTRLVRGWTHLERQKGGIGLRGPGETQLETDRRLIGNAGQGCYATGSTKLEQAARSPAAFAHAPACAVGGAGGLYQCRQVHAVQCADARRRLRRRPVVRHAGHHHAQALSAQVRAKWCCRTRSVSSPTCRTTWWPPSVPRWKPRPRPICCCMWSMPPARARAPDRGGQQGTGEKSARMPCRSFAVYNKLDLTGVAPGVERDEYGKTSKRVMFPRKPARGLNFYAMPCQKSCIAERVQGEAGAPDDNTSQPTVHLCIS